MQRFRCYRAQTTILDDIIRRERWLALKIAYVIYYDIVNYMRLQVLLENRSHHDD